jgi:hypothetical protein
MTVRRDKSKTIDFEGRVPGWRRAWFVLLATRLSENEIVMVKCFVNAGLGFQQRANF